MKCLNTECQFYFQEGCTMEKYLIISMYGHCLLARKKDVE